MPAALQLAAAAIVGAASMSSDVSCLRAAATLAEGGVAKMDTFVPAACPNDMPAAAFRYDAASHTVRLSRAIAAGDIVSSFPAGSEIEPGDTLQLVSRVAGVRIVRQVQALQPASPGMRLFVRTDDGDILSVRFEKIAP